MTRAERIEEAARALVEAVRTVDDGIGYTVEAVDPGALDALRAAILRAEGASHSTSGEG